MCIGKWKIYGCWLFGMRKWTKITKVVGAFHGGGPKWKIDSSSSNQYEGRFQKLDSWYVYSEGLVDECSLLKCGGSIQQLFRAVWQKEACQKNEMRESERW